MGLGWFRGGLGLFLCWFRAGLNAQGGCQASFVVLGWFGWVWVLLRVESPRDQEDRRPGDQETERPADQDTRDRRPRD